MPDAAGAAGGHLVHTQGQHGHVLSAWRLRRHHSSGPLRGLQPQVHHRQRHP